MNYRTPYLLYDTMLPMTYGIHEKNYVPNDLLNTTHISVTGNDATKMCDWNREGINIKTKTVLKMMKHMDKLSQEMLTNLDSDKDHFDAIEYYYSMDAVHWPNNNPKYKSQYNYFRDDVVKQLETNKEAYQKMNSWGKYISMY